MLGTAIVAIPKEDSYIWSLSSEKVPHLTLLFLGDQSDNPNLNKIIDFVETLTSNNPFNLWLEFNIRGYLGKDGADILLLKDKEYQALNFRNRLLRNPHIQEAYNSLPQYPNWNPHITLGYPDNPAKYDEKKNLYGVEFDRIAVWTGDFEGPEFRLNTSANNLSMSEENDIFLAHYGVKGMKWGVRKDRGERKTLRAQVKEARKRKYEKRREAYGNMLSSRKVKAKNFTEEELVANIRRLRLEDEYLRLSTPKKSEGRQYTESIMKDIGRQYVTKLASTGLNTATYMAFDKAANAAGISGTQKSFYEAMAKRPKKG